MRLLTDDGRAWVTRRACGPFDPATFEPLWDDNRDDVKETFDERAARHAKAKAICATCPVTAECLAFAVENEYGGIWGGQLAPNSCGRPSGFARHRRNGEAVCEACRLAHNAENRAQRAAAKERTAA